MQAAILTGDYSANVVLYDITPLSLGVEILGGIMSTIIKRNTPIPAKQTGTYITVEDNQTAISVVVYEGERILAKDNYYLGCFTLTNIPPRARGEVQITKTISIDVNEILTVTAMENMTQQHKSLNYQKR